jgi:alanine-glyoxylate transaminase/(R)-3-amino-2-methylpropionate-pyruvate transaminase
MPVPACQNTDTFSFCYTFSQAFAGIVTVSVGHCHPGVVSAVQAQLSRLMHTTTIYLHNEIAQYAQELTDRLPGNLKVLFRAITAMSS